MLELFRKIRILLSTYYAYMLEYRAELLLWALSGSLPFILMGVWIEAADSGQFPYGPEAFARYFLAVFMVRQMTVVYVIWEFEAEVVQGKLSPLLLQPMDPVWRHVASHVSERAARLPFAAAILVLFFVLYPEAFWIPDLMAVLSFCLVVVLAFALRFIIQYTLALCAFWTERASALEDLWFLIYLFLSGLVAPLEVFPPAVRAVVEWTPFPYLVHFPASLLIGAPVDVGRSLSIMVGWMALALGINRWLWRKGLRRYSGMGA